MERHRTVARRRARLVAAGVMMVLGAWLLIGTQARNAESAAQRARRLGKQHNIVLAFDDPKAFYAAPYDPSDAELFGVQASRTDDESAAIALDAIELALKQYPAGFVAKLIRAVFIAGELRVGGAVAGGTVGPAWIILAAPKRLGKEGIFATSYIGVHHELSSFVLHKDPGTLTRWLSFQPADWKYAEDPKDKIAVSAGKDPEPSTGFLSAYGGTDPENDFNVYAEKIFTEPQRVSELAKANALVGEKLRFVLATYCALDSRMERAFADLKVME